MDFIPSFEIIPVHYGYMETTRTQRSFPRSKKKRVRERWAKRKDNFTETTIHRMVVIGRKIYTSPEVFTAIKGMDATQLQDISGALKKLGITVRVTMPNGLHCADLKPNWNPTCEEIPTERGQRARLAIEKMKGRAPVVGVCDDYVVLAQDQEDLKNKMGKIRSGDTQGFYTIERVLLMQLNYTMKQYTNLREQAAQEMHDKFSKMGNIPLPKGFNWKDEMSCGTPSNVLSLWIFPKNKT